MNGCLSITVKMRFLVGESNLNVGLNQISEFIRSHAPELKLGCGSVWLKLLADDE